MMLSGSGFKNKKSNLSYSEELGNVLLWDIVEDKMMHGCKRKSVKFTEKKKCLLDVVICLLPPAPYNVELDAENASGRNTILHFSSFSAFLLWVWSGQMPDLTQPFLQSHNHEIHMVPEGSFLAPASFLPQLRLQFLNLFSNNHGPSPSLWP